MAAIGCSPLLEKSDVVGNRGRTVVVFGWFEEGLRKFGEGSRKVRGGFEEGSRRVRGRFEEGSRKVRGGFEGAHIRAMGLQRKRASTPKHDGSAMGWKTEATLALTLHYCQHEIWDREAGGEFDGSAASCLASTASTRMAA